MNNSLKLSLKPNEKLYINGAVIRVDRKVTVELLNDVQFLLENHVLQPEEASTPLKQLYFILQIMLMNPQGAVDARDMFRRSLPLMLANFTDEQIRGTLKNVDRMVGRRRRIGEMNGMADRGAHAQMIPGRLDLHPRTAGPNQKITHARAVFVGLGPDRIPVEPSRSGRIDLRAADRPAMGRAPRDRGGQAAAYRRAQFRFDP